MYNLTAMWGRELRRRDVNKALRMPKIEAWSAV
jgi:hypothetical protein